MKKLYIFFAFCFITSMALGNDLLDKTMLHMRESFQKLVEYNEANDLRGESHKNNYFFFYEPLVDYVPQPPTANWLLQIPDETFPNADKWSSELTKYNNLGEYEHYVIVIYINSVLQSKIYEVLDNEDTASPSWFKLYYDNLENIPDTNDATFYKNQILELRTYFKQHFKLSSIFTESKNKYISFCTVINYYDNILGEDQTNKKQLVKIKGYHASDASPSFLQGIEEFYALRDQKYPGEGIARIGQRIRAFVDKFYNEVIKDLPCIDLANKATSQEAGSYIAAQCPKIKTEFDKEFVIQSAAYLDYVRYMYEAFGSNDNVFALTDYVSYVNTLSDYYFQNANGVDPKLIMRSYWDDEANSADHGDYLKRLYFKYFYNINQESLEDLENVIVANLKMIGHINDHWASMSAYYPTLIYETLNRAEELYQELYFAFSSLSEGAYSHQELNDAFTNINFRVSFLDVAIWQDVIYGVGLPYCGCTEDQLILAISNFIVKSKMNYDVANPTIMVSQDNIENNFIVDKFANSFDPTLTLPGNVNTMDFVSSYSYDYNQSTGKFKINYEYCTEPEIEHSDIGGSLFATINCNDTDIGFVEDIGFFDIVHKVTLSHPEVLENYGFDGSLPTQGYQTSYPVAGFSIPAAVQLQELEAFEKNLFLSIQILGTVSSFGMYATATTTLRAFFAGALVLNNLLAIAIIENEAEFRQNMKNWLGEERGNEITDVIILVNAALGGVEAIYATNVFGLLKTAEQKKIAAFCKYLDEAVEHTTTVPQGINANTSKIISNWLTKVAEVNTTTASSIQDLYISLFNLSPSKAALIENSPDFKRFLFRAYEGKPNTGMPVFINEQMTFVDLENIIVQFEKFDNFQLANWASGGATDASNIRRLKTIKLLGSITDDFPNDISIVKRLNEDIIANPLFDNYLLNNSTKYNIWLTVPDFVVSSLRGYVDPSLEWSYLSNLDHYLNYSPDPYTTKSLARRHLKTGETEIQFSKTNPGGSTTSKSFYFPSYNLMDESLETEGLVNKILEIRDLMKNEGFIPRPLKINANSPYKSTAHGIKKSDGNHGLYEYCNNCNQEGVGLSSWNGLNPQKKMVIHEWSNGDEIFQMEYPSTMIPSLEGWDYIKNSTMVNPVDIINHLKNNGLVIHQHKTNSPITTLHQIPSEDFDILISMAHTLFRQNPVITNKPIVNYNGQNFKFNIVLHNVNSDPLQIGELKTGFILEKL